ncbi:MAG: FHA domain-containing protein [Planctomycetes bacterium]|nr:FHA domain-containing protein [Planctomycetota bacterium]
MKAELRVLRGEGTGRSFVIPSIGRFTLGRSPDCQIRFNDPGISGSHCLLDRLGEVDVVVDLESRNGTFVNGHRVQRQQLTDGDLLVIGETALQYHVVRDTAAAGTTTRLVAVETGWTKAQASVCDRIAVREQGFWDLVAEPGDAAGTEKLRRALAGVHKLAAGSAAHPSLVEAMAAGLEVALDTLGGDRAAVVLLPQEPGFQGLELVRRQGPTAALDRMVISKTVIDACLREGVSVLTSFPESGGATQSILSAGIKSVLCVPIESETHSLGVLYVDSLSAVDRFRRGDLAILAALASLLGALAEKRILAGRVEETEHRLAEVLRHAPVGLFVAGLDGRIATWNPGCERLLGRASADVVGAAGLELLLGSHGLAERAMSQVNAGTDLELEREFAGREGRPFLGALALRRYLDAGGAHVGYVGILLDVTDRRALQDELAREERMATLGLLVAGVSHDFRNLLTPLSGYAELAEHNPAQAPKLVKAVRTASGQGRALTEALLVYARRRDDRYEATDLSGLVDAVAGLVSGELDHCGILVDRRYSPVPPVEANPGLLQSVFMNLLLNAKEAMAQGGTLTIRIEAESDAAAEPAPTPTPTAESAGGAAANLAVSAAAPAAPAAVLGRVRIEFEDTGSGMPPETVANLFQPFFSTKSGAAGGRRGCGLGLYMSLQTVRRHGGDLSCRSTLGKGTVFTLRLPLRHPVQPTADPGPTTDAPARRGCEPTIILAAGSEMRQLWADLMGERPHRLAADVAAATAAAREGGARLVFLDLPAAQAAVAAESLRTACAALRLVAVTDVAPDQARANPHYRFADAFLQKPFTLAEVLGQLEDKARSPAALGGAT